MKISPPAFPTYLADNMAHGMTLRDYFAAAALIGLLCDTGGCENAKDYAIDAYTLANAMLAERDR